MLANAASSVMVGNHISNMMQISGIVERLWVVPGQDQVRVKVRQGNGSYRYMLIFGTGMQVEVSA